MYLSYSGFKLAYECLYAYWHEYINKTPLEEPDDRLGSVYGSIVGTLFEDFYNYEWWRKDQPQAYVMSQVEAVTDRILKQETSPTKWGRPGGVLKWKGPKSKGGNPRAMYADKDELMADVRDGVARGFKIIRHDRLLGPYAKAEVRLDGVVDGHKLGGRADFIIQRIRPHSDRGIYDGKGSKYRDRYVSPKQLYWYAMLYRLKYNKLPDKLAFVYWRFSPPESIDWVEFSEADLDALLDEVLAMINRIEKGKADLPEPGKVPDIDLMELARKVFRPRANEDNCRFCPRATATQCSWGFAVRQEMEQRKRR
jgi:hypothetical protein